MRIKDWKIIGDPKRQGDIYALDGDNQIWIWDYDLNRWVKFSRDE